ncbi:hypothetical protein PgNI_11003 [Pyricularia grisea]|uniref:Uncharacterized protein n=1 Tax=Pyricularia grisea TaxID=148305 RepID=A0A6P8AZD0_PYRGI|nr:hypothetical protein PgNI_11003 [Pyricularia grisea]TLD07697.1 hypothetical protein PgNI_11003 [Pyricularia grisea]
MCVDPLDDAHQITVADELVVVRDGPGAPGVGIAVHYPRISRQPNLLQYPCALKPGLLKQGREGGPPWVLLECLWRSGRGSHGWRISGQQVRYHGCGATLDILRTDTGQYPASATVDESHDGHLGAALGHVPLVDAESGAGLVLESEAVQSPVQVRANGEHGSIHGDGAGIAQLIAPYVRNCVVGEARIAIVVLLLFSISIME